MDEASLIAELKAFLMKVAEKFTADSDGDFKRHLRLAASDLSRIAPVYVRDELTLVAGTALYECPADLRSVVQLLWGNAERALPQFDSRYPGRMPRIGVVRSAGVRKLELSPAPTIAQIGALGSTAAYRYLIEQKVAVAAGDTTVPEHRRGALIVLAASFAMHELANRGSFEPMKIGDGYGVQAKNGVPASLAEQLRRTAEEMAA